MKVYFGPNAAQDQLYAVLAPVVDRFRGMSGEEQIDFLGQLTDYPFYSEGAMADALAAWQEGYEINRVIETLEESGP